MSAPPSQSYSVEVEGDRRRDGSRAAALAELSGSLAESFGDASGILDLIAQLVSNFLGDIAVLRLLSEDGTSVKVAAVYDKTPARMVAARKALELVPEGVDDQPVHELALAGTQPVSLTADEFEKFLDTLPAESQRRLRRLHLTSVLICPLRGAGTVVGTLGLWRQGRAPHSERDRDFAQELADRAAMAIVNERLVEQLRHDLEERTRNEESLRLTNELLQRADGKRRALIDHLVTAQEEERRRIAVDVHDDTIQAMAAVGVRLQIMRRHAPTEEIAKQVTQLEDIVAETIGRLRSLLFRLEATSVETVGVDRAIQRYVTEVFHDGSVQTSVKSTVTLALDSACQIVLYRVAQEALMNVFKHAAASRLTVSLADSGEGVELTVVDNGAGFDPAKAIRHALPGHLGMRAMEERAAVAGGRFSIESRPRAGTTIRCWVPALGAPDAELEDEE